MVDARTFRAAACLAGWLVAAGAVMAVGASAGEPDLGEVVRVTPSTLESLAGKAFSGEFRAKDSLGVEYREQADVTFRFGAEAKKGRFTYANAAYSNDRAWETEVALEDGALILEFGFGWRRFALHRHGDGRFILITEYSYAVESLFVARPPVDAALLLTED